jgi:hypothetical protein
MPTNLPIVRVYNVRFGDCFLVTIFEPKPEKHILIDFGNAAGAAKSGGGENDVFTPIAEDILKRTHKHLNLIILSHEHLDHMEGFYSQTEIFDQISVDDVWMPIMSNPKYDSGDSQFHSFRLAQRGLFNLTQRWDQMGRLECLPEEVISIIQNNVLDLSNRDRINYLRQLPKSPKHVHYLYRGMDTRSRHTLGSGVDIRVLAPEKDANVYFSKKDTEMWLNAAQRLGSIALQPKGSTKCPAPTAPYHMEQDEFEHLREEISELDTADLFAINKAANNTSLVIEITVGGKTLLFPGDAEDESWAIMKKKGLLEPVDILKVAHHGSINGMPFEGEQSVVPDLVKRNKKTKAIVSTREGVYGTTEETAIPNKRLMTVLKTKCTEVLITEHSIGLGAHRDIKPE